MSPFPPSPEKRTLFGQLPRFQHSLVLWTLTSIVALGIGCQGGTETKMSEIRSLQEAGQFDPSIAPLRQVLSDEPDHPEANYRLGIALVQTGRPSLAVWPLQKASQTDSHAVPAGLLLASTLMQNGTNEEAVRAATKVLDLEPENVTALFTRANANLVAGQPEKTLEDADAILALRPDDTAATSLRGGALIDLNRVDEAEALWQGLYERASASGNDDDAARKCSAVATFYRSQKEDEKAAEQFDECLEAYPANPLVQQWVADFYIETGQPAKAIDVWRKAVDATPEDLGLRGKLADLLSDEAHREEGEAFLQETVELFDTPQAWRMLSSFYRKLGEPGKAREALEAAMERSGNVTPPLRFALADMLIEEGDLDRAEEVAASINEPSYRNLLDGAILLERDEPAAALAKLETGLRLWPNNAGARYLAGRAALGVGDEERAITEFREAVRVGESETDAALRLAEIYYGQGAWGNAQQFASRQMTKRPFINDRAHVIAARSHIELENWEQAEGVLQNLKTREPESARPYVEFAELKRRREGPQAAADAILEAPIDLDAATNVEVLRALATNLLEVGRGDEAQRRVASAAAKNPESLTNIDLHARVLAATGRSDQARKKFEQVLAADPDFALSLDGMGSLAREAGRFDEARIYYDKAAEASDDTAAYFYSGAQVSLMMGDIDGAVERLRAAVELDPGHLGANNDLAFLLAQGGQRLDDALAFAQRAVRLDRTAETLDTLGYVHLKRGDVDQAITVLTRALDARPDSPSIEYRLGLARSASGDKEGAREILTKALGGDTFPEAQEAQAALDQLRES